jgi:hypothetical protein
MQASGAQDLEMLERLPPTQSGGDQDELHQTARGAGDVLNV